MIALVNRQRCVCGARPGQEHLPRCPYPLAVVDQHPELWTLSEKAPLHRTDDTLESCNRNAVRAWVRAGRNFA